MKTIEERARLAAWQIFGEIGLSEHSVGRVSEIIEDKILEQKAIDIDRACEWLDRYLHLFVMKGRIYRAALKQEFRKAMEE